MSGETTLALAAVRKSIKSVVGDGCAGWKRRGKEGAAERGGFGGDGGRVGRRKFRVDEELVGNHGNLWLVLLLGIQLCKCDFCPHLCLLHPDLK